MAYLQGDVYSVGIARQTNHTTENTTDNEFGYFKGVVSWPDHTQQFEDMGKAGSGQPGAWDAPSPGSLDGGTFDIEFYAACLKSGYDADTEEPGDTGVLSLQASLVGWALGSLGSSGVSSAAEFLAGYLLSRQPYVSGDVAGSPTTSTTPVSTTASYKAGNLLVADTTKTTGSPTVAFIKTRATGGPPDDLTHFEAAQNAASSGDDVYGSATAFYSEAECMPATIRLMGNNAAFKYSYIGCVPVALEGELHAGKVPKFKITVRYTDRKRYSSGGGLQAISEFQRCQPVMGSYGGRLTIDGAATCGYHELAFSAQWEATPNACHGAAQGVDGVTRKLTSLVVTAKVPVDSSESIASNKSPWEMRFENQTDISLGFETGTLPGRILAGLFPALHQSRPPQLADLNGLVAHDIELRPSQYTSDTDDGNAADSVMRIGFA